MLKARNSSLRALLIGASLLFLIAISFPVKVATAPSPAQSADTLVGTMLTGKIQGVDGKPLEGVTVSARDVDKTITTSVFTDAQGNYFFPVLDKGKYRLWVQAVGYELEQAEVKLEPSKETRQDFTLKALNDFINQLNGAEWMAALPDDTFENARMKQIFQHNCSACHTPSFVLQNRFDEAGWRAILTTMETTTAVGGRTKEPWANIHHFKDELAAYLAKVRGPGASPMTFHPLPRPAGEATHVIVTEYDIPSTETSDQLQVENGSNWSEGTPSDFGNRGTHDVTADFFGNAWISSFMSNSSRSYAKVDAKTGKVNNYKAPLKDNWVRVSHGIVTGQDGIIWLNLSTGKASDAGSLGRIDPNTGKLDIFTPPEGMTRIGSHVDVDGNGKVWAVTRKGGLRFDPDTSKFIEFKSPNWSDPTFSTYGLAADSNGNGWWAILTQDRIGASDIETNKVREVHLKPRSETEKYTTEEDRKWYNRTDNLGPLSNNNSAPWARTPRRLAGDHSGPYIWSANFFGQDIASVNIETLEVRYFDLPIPYASAYDLDVDGSHAVWVSLRDADSLGRFDPKTEKWTVYTLPTLGVEARNINVDQKTGNVWLASWRTNKAIRLQLRTEQQLAAVQAKTTATKERIAGVSSSLGRTINAGSNEPATETTMGKKLFLQRCSVCHLGIAPSYETYGPSLHKELVTAMGEDGVRKIIMEGSPRMPGWKYSLRPADIDNILAYLKTVTKEEVSHRPSDGGGG